MLRDPQTVADQLTTRLSRLHPYPAMVADPLALELVSTYVAPGDAVLDPFCGSGRLLAAAASLPGRKVGVDTNPLAALVTGAKLADADPDVLSTVIGLLDSARAGTRRGFPSVQLRQERRVQWFPANALAELGDIIAWINCLDLEPAETLLVAAAFSATVRDASYARKDGWKLHRMNADARRRFSPAPWQIFARRLAYCESELRRGCNAHLTDCHVEVSDIRALASGSIAATRGAYDVVLTSPPYGDSLSTVQYGAASALCLELVSQIRGMEALFVRGAEVDSRCLGGRRRIQANTLDPRPFWAGSRLSPQCRTLGHFLADYAVACGVVGAAVRDGGTVVFVVGQRSVGGFRVKLDAYTAEQFNRLGFSLVSQRRRTLQGKRLPSHINRFGRASTPEVVARGVTKTMASEIVLVFRKRASRRVRLAASLPRS
jgi:site-specific DNA-methyltransferase (cytosine-N4-specific)